MVLLPGCKCCGGGGPCWRCYERYDLPESCGDVPPDLQCCERAKPPAVLILKLGDVIYDNTLTDDRLFVGGTVGATGCLDDFKATFNPVCNKEYRLKWNNQFQCWATPLADLNTDISIEIRPQIRVSILCEGIDVSFYEYTRQDSHGAFVPTQPDGTTLMRTLFSNKGGLNCSIFENPSIPIEVPKYYFNTSGSPVPPSSPAAWAHVFYMFFENASPGSPTAAGRAEIEIVEVAFDTSTLPDSPTIGTCCTPTGDCTDTTFQECEDQCGIWTPDATCEDNPCEPAEAEEYQCFDAPPDEEGWLPVGDCHATEEECALSCPSVPFCECEEPNVLGNQLTMTLQDFTDTGYTPPETENITCTPEQLFSQIQEIPFNAPFFEWSKSDGTSFDTAVWSETGLASDGMLATAACVNYGFPPINYPISCNVEEDLGTDCLESFEEENPNVFPSRVEWTPESVIVGINLYQAGTTQRICEFTNTGTTLLEFDKAYGTDSGEGFRVIARWENLNYIGDEAYPWPRFKYLRLAEFKTDMLLSINGTPATTPSGGRTMPTTKATTGPGTHLKNMLGWVGIRAKEKGCKCGHMEKKMNQGPQWCRDHKDEILAHLATEAKKRGLPFVRMAAGKLVDLAIRRAERGQ